MNNIVSLSYVFFLINILGAMEGPASRPTSSNKAFTRTLYDIRSWLVHNNVNLPASYLEIKPEYLEDEKIIVISERKFMYLKWQAHSNAIKLINALNAKEKELSLERLNDPESITILNFISSILKEDGEYYQSAVKVPAKNFWAMVVFLGYDPTKKGKKCPFYVKNYDNTKWKSVNIRLPE